VAEDPPNVFEPVTKTDWIAKVESDLKGAAIESLRTKLPGGLVLEPLYVPDDAPKSRGTGLPGLFPFVRGASPTGGWTIRQLYDDPRREVCARLIRTDLERGVEALYLRLGPRHGCRLQTIDDLDELLASVDLASTSLWLDPELDAMAVAAGLFAVAERREVGAMGVHGCLGADPVGILARQGRLEGGLRARMSELQDLGVWCGEHAPSMSAICVNGDVYHEAGASMVVELAATLATGVEYLRRLTDAGLTIDAAADQIRFVFPISSDFFSQVAKLRAARGLWSKTLVAAGAEARASAMRIHAMTSRFTKTQRDPWVNMLRATAECTAAVIGGAESITTLPFDGLAGSPSELAQRVARNTQLVLREESHLAEVIDPAGGSWFVETLTEQLERAAWDLFQRIEREGGIVAALGSGRLVDSIRDEAQELRQRVSTRKIPIVGVSEFPNPGEEPLERDRVGDEEIRQRLKKSVDELDLGAHRGKLIAIARTVESQDRKPGRLTDVCVGAAIGGTDMYSIATVLQHGQPDFHVEPVSTWRQAELWEQLRNRVDQHAEAGERPRAFLANLGSVASHKARSHWAQNLLAAVGVESSTNDGFADPAALEEAYRQSGARIAVVCGSDTDYERLLEPAVDALKRGGCPIVLVAGRPGERESSLREAGVSDFVFVGADVLAIMRRVLDAAEVGR